MTPYENVAFWHRSAGENWRMIGMLQYKKCSFVKMSLFFWICFFTLFHKIVCWHRILSYLGNKEFSFPPWQGIITHTFATSKPYGALSRWRNVVQKLNTFLTMESKLRQTITAFIASYKSLSFTVYWMTCSVIAKVKLHSLFMVINTFPTDDEVYCFTQANAYNVTRQGENSSRKRVNRRGERCVVPHEARFAAHCQQRFSVNVATLISH